MNVKGGKSSVTPLHTYMQTRMMTSVDRSRKTEPGQNMEVEMPEALVTQQNGPYEWRGLSLGASNCLEPVMP